MLLLSATLTHESIGRGNPPWTVSQLFFSFPSSLSTAYSPLPYQVLGRQEDIEPQVCLSYFDSNINFNPVARLPSSGFVRSHPRYF